MKKTLVFCLFWLCIGAAPCQAHILEDLWNKYLPETSVPKETSKHTQKQQAPGRIIGTSSPERNTEFNRAWKYRQSTFEMYYDDATALAATIYNLALYVGDIDESLPRDKFLRAVLGYHYSTSQICAWLNAVLAQISPAPSKAEYSLVGILLQDGVLCLKKGKFAPTGKISHVLAAAAGKKKSFAKTLHHERIHVFWDEDADFRKSSHDQWNALSEQERAKERADLSRYNQKNEKQIVEEWAVHRAEAANRTIN